MIVWALLVYGVTLVITGSRIFQPVRSLFEENHWYRAAQFLRCPLCVGFWIGLASWFIFPSLCPIPYLLPHAAIGNAFVSSAVCWIFHVVLAKLGAEDL